TTASVLYPLSLHDALPISFNADEFFQLYAHLAKDRDHRFDTATQYCSVLMNMFGTVSLQTCREIWRVATHQCDHFLVLTGNKDRSEEHTSELQSRENLVCR